MSKEKKNRKLITGVVLGGIVGGVAYLIDSKTGGRVSKRSKGLVKKAVGTAADNWNNIVPDKFTFSRANGEANAEESDEAGESAEAASGEASLDGIGELLVSTEAGKTYKVHLTGATFDAKKKVITLSTPEAEYLIEKDAIDSVESVRKSNKRF